MARVSHNKPVTTTKETADKATEALRVCNAARTTRLETFQQDEQKLLNWGL